MLESLIFFLGICLFYFSHWLVSVLLVKFGSYTDAGIFSLAMSIGTMFFTLISYGMRQYQITDIKNKFSDNEYVLSRKITSIIGIVAFAIYMAIMQYPSDYAMVIVGYFLFKLFEAYIDVYNAISQKYNQLWVSGLSLSLRAMSILMVFFFVFLKYHNLIQMVFLMALFELVTGFLFDYSLAKSKGSFSFNFGKDELYNAVSLLICVAPLMVNTFFVNSFSSISKIVVEKILNAELLGYYSSIYSPTVVITLFVSSILMFISPKIAESYNRSENLQVCKILVKTLSVIGIITVLAFFLAFACGKELFALVFDESILNYFSLFYWVIVSTSLLGVTSVYSSFFIAFRKIKIVLYFSSFSFVLNVILSIICVKNFGIYGAAYATIISLICQIVPETVCLLKAIKSKIYDSVEAVK